MVKATIDADGTVILTMDRETATDLRLWLVLSNAYRTATPTVGKSAKSAETLWEALHDVTARGLSESIERE